MDSLSSMMRIHHIYGYINIYMYIHIHTYILCIIYQIYLLSDENEHFHNLTRKKTLNDTQDVTGL